MPRGAGLTLKASALDTELENFDLLAPAGVGGEGATCSVNSGFHSAPFGATS
jgi:hypothetical protein